MSLPPRSRAPRFTVQQKQKLKEWLVDGKQWISIDEAIQLIETCLTTTRGHAQKLWKDARASGEVRFANDDGVVADPRYDYMCRRDDLVGGLIGERRRSHRRRLTNRARNTSKIARGEQSRPYG